MALSAVALLFGTRVAETILASVHVRAHLQAGHMDASDLIKALQNTLRGGGRPHMGLGQLALLWHFRSVLKNPPVAVRATIRNRRWSEQPGDDGAADLRQRR